MGRFDGNTGNGHSCKVWLIAHRSNAMIPKESSSVYLQKSSKSWISTRSAGYDVEVLEIGDNLIEQPFLRIASQFHSEPGVSHVEIDNYDGWYLDVSKHNEDGTGPDNNKVKVYKGGDKGHPTNGWWLSDCLSPNVSPGQYAESDGCCTVTDAW